MRIFIFFIFISHISFCQSRQNIATLKSYIEHELPKKGPDKLTSGKLREITDVIADQVIALDKNKMPVLSVKGLKQLRSPLPDIVYISDSNKRGYYTLDGLEGLPENDPYEIILNESGKRYRRDINFVRVKDFGAKGDNINDDTKSIQAAFTFCKKIKKAVLVFEHDAIYKITGPIIYDLSKQSRIKNNEYSLTIQGNNSTIWINGKTDSFWVFSFLYSEQAEQDSKLSINGLWFQTNNINRPNGILTKYAHFLEVHNVVFFQLWNGIKVERAGMGAITNTYAFGCQSGFDSQYNRDTKLDNCLSFGCGVGFLAEGGNDGGVAGGLSILNSYGVANSTNFILSRLQTARFVNIVSDVPTKEGILIRSCNYLQASNILCGPNQKGSRSAIHITRDSRGSNNDYCQFDNIIAENEIILDYLNFSSISNLVSTRATNSSSEAALNISNSKDVYLNNATMRDLNTLYSIRVRPNCAHIVINAGDYEKKIYIEGIKRLGQQIINGAVMREDILFDGAPLQNEIGYYYLSGKKKTIENGFLIPSLVMPQVIMNKPGQIIDFDLNKIIPRPEIGSNYRAVFVSNSGIFGSFGTAVIEVIRNYENTKATIINEIPSMSVTVGIISGNIIRFTCTASNAGTIAKLTLVEISTL